MKQIVQDCRILEHEIKAIGENRSSLRRKERELKIREEALKQQYKAGVGPSTTAKGLSASLRHILPNYLYPGNVGMIEDAYWAFYYTFDFDFGTNPVLTSNSRLSTRIEVSQEAAFIATNISVDTADNTDASFRGPYTVNLIDNQSSRQLNESPIPIQSLGKKSNPTKLPTGYLVMPNSSMTLEVGTWIPVGNTMNTTGDGRIQFVVGGIRIRTDAFRSVLSKVF